VVRVGCNEVVFDRFFVCRLFSNWLIGNFRNWGVGRFHRGGGMLSCDLFSRLSFNGSYVFGNNFVWLRDV
jgi:hypothetical protein